MKPLKTEELKQGVIYKCLLSGKPVLITSLDHVSGFGFKFPRVQGKIFIDNRYEEIYIDDYQLSEHESI